jgi:P-type Ca2+ transporter type 2C
MVKVTVSAESLDSINEEREASENLKALSAIGGIEQLIKGLKTDINAGITACSERDLAERRSTHGSNKMPEPEVVTWWAMFVESFEDTTVQILMAAAVISLAVGLYEDPTGGWVEGTTILAAVVIVAVVTATNNYKKEAQFRNLSRMKDKIDVSVMRGGELMQVSIDDVVVGDIVHLSSGDKVPSDGLVVNVKSADGLFCNESAITGESEDRAKTCVAGLCTSSAHSRVEQDPYLLSGTVVGSGAGTMLVIAVGPRSRWGRTKAIEPQETPNTPLQDKLDVLAAQIGNGGMVAAAATFAAMLYIWFAHPESRIVHHDSEGVELSYAMQLFEIVLKAFIMAVTIVVVAVPEGLPLAVTVSLAYSTSKMMKDNNLIRVLSACETMGNATCICSDKTGTLTQNQMTVVSCWSAGAYFPSSVPGATEIDEGVLSFLAEGIAVNTTANIIQKAGAVGGQIIVGNRTESALLLMLQKHYDINYGPLREEGFNDELGDRLFSFTSTRKRMSTLQMGRKVGRSAPKAAATLYTKGAAEVLLALSEYMATGSLDKSGLVQSQPIGVETRAALADFISASARKSLRCIAVCHRYFSAAEVKKLGLDDASTPVDVEELEGALVLDAIYCISDPLRPDVPAAIERCHEAGIVVRMITGDNIETARAIAAECGILTKAGTALDGPTFRKLTPAQLDEKLPTLQVLARSSPIDKYNLVSRLNGVNLPTTREEWELVHPGSDWETQRDLLLPGYREEWEASRKTGRYNREVVGVTGDGTNDAPALRVADVGLSMGLCGTEAAKEASDIVILDDNFSSIVKAVLWGRAVYDNIRKFLQFQLTVNIVALVVTFVCALYGIEPPLNAVMMLCKRFALL